VPCTSCAELLSEEAAQTLSGAQAAGFELGPVLDPAHGSAEGTCSRSRSRGKHSVGVAAKN